jgi:hypothetical protein
MSKSPESTPARRGIRSSDESASRLSPATSEQSFLGFAAGRLRQLAGATEAIDAHGANAVLKDLLEPWGRERIGKFPKLSSDIGDDQFPIEFSVAFFETDVELRVLLESRGPDPSMLGRWAAGEEVNRRLEKHYGVSVGRLHAIEDLFLPTDPCARYAMWHSVCWRPNRPLRFKVYLNPQARGARCASAVVAEAVRRLGFPEAAERLSTPAREGEELKFFSLDIEHSNNARVKVYKVHHSATRHDIESELGLALGYSADALRTFFGAIVASDGPFCGLPMSTYLAWESGDQVPCGGTIHFPIRDYVDNDQVVFERVRGFLSGKARATYERMVAAFASRPLQRGVGMHSYVSWGLDRRGSRTTVYLSPEAYSVHPARSTRAASYGGDRGAPS